MVAIIVTTLMNFPKGSLGPSQQTSAFSPWRGTRITNINPTCNVFTSWSESESEDESMDVDHPSRDKTPSPKEVSQDPPSSPKRKKEKKISPPPKPKKKRKKKLRTCKVANCLRCQNGTCKYRPSRSTILRLLPESKKIRRTLFDEKTEPRRLPSPTTTRLRQYYFEKFEIWFTHFKSKSGDSREIERALKLSVREYLDQKKKRKNIERQKQRDFKPSY